MDWSVEKILSQSCELFNFNNLYDTVSGKRWNHWADQLADEIPAAFEVAQNGHLPMWKEIYTQLPFLRPDEVILDQPIIKVRSNNLPDEEVTQLIEELLLKMHPWRKGPFRIHNIYIDTEWQSHQKWERLKDDIAPLQNRRILDVGCGNGYYALRMLGEGAKFVIGVDPYLRYIVQFRMLTHFMRDATENAMLAPVGFESLPDNLEMFDTIFSMGVIYHHRSPFEHLQKIFDGLRSGGEVIMESIVVDGNEQTILCPQDRYTKMRNVWFLPSALALENWIKRVGFQNVRTINISTTSMQEQRTTRWMPFESLADFLDPADSNKSFEGYPAPKRAIILAEKP